ncbi:hypothetical protein ACIQFP_07690 [Nocardiopsis alba]|uniref:hypothetical protein n=1 Tax=Nocardiopsis alba TaxID=53437 RepID=UPI0037FF6667
MAMFVHLTPRANAARVEHAGVRPTLGQKGTSGVFCFPTLPSYALTHHWSHELSRHHGPRGLIAIDVRLPDDEPVTVGHFADGNGPRAVTAAEAVRVIVALRDPLGWEVVVPRPILREEVQAIREIRWTSDRGPFPESPSPLLPAPRHDEFPQGPLPESLALADLPVSLPCLPRLSPVPGQAGGGEPPRGR